MTIETEEDFMKPRDPIATMPLSTLKWWRELVDLNPQDLAPRMDEVIKRFETAK